MNEFYNTQLGEPWEPRDPESLKVARQEAAEARAAANKRVATLARHDYRPDGFCQQLDATATRLEELVKKMENAERIKREAGHPVLRLTIADDQSFKTLIDKYYYAPQLEAAEAARQIIADAYPPNYHPEYRAFIMRRSVKAHPTFQDLVSDYAFCTVFRGLWFEYTT